MGDVAIFETTHDMGDSVAFADIGQKLIAQAFAFRGPAHEASNVNECQSGRDDLLRAGDFRQRVETRVRHRHFTDIGFDRAEWIIRGLRRRCLGEGVEKSRFADIRQTDDTTFETHDLSRTG